MRSTSRQGVLSSVFCVFIAALALTAVSTTASAQTHMIGAATQTHVISATELHQQLLDAARVRQANIKTLAEFVSSPKAEQALRLSHMDPVQVQAAVSSLGDDELAQLAARAAKAQLNFAAGDLSDRDLLLIIVGIAALILIIVAVR